MGTSMGFDATRDGDILNRKGLPATIEIEIRTQIGKFKRSIHVHGLEVHAAGILQGFFSTTGGVLP